MSFAPCTLADAGITGLIVPRETFTSQDVFAAGFDGRQEGIAYGIVLASMEQAKHARSAARSAVGHIVDRLPQIGEPYAGLVCKSDLADLAAEFRALAEALDAAAKAPAAPALRDAT